MKWILVLLVACGPPRTLAPSAPVALPPHATVAIDRTPLAHRRLVAPEVYLRAYLTWFGGLAPLAVQQAARAKGMFDAWDDYLAALGLPDYRLDIPRQGQTNTLMLATLGRLGEVLCMRAAERDLRSKPPIPVDARVIFAFEPTRDDPTPAEFAARFDVLHRTFLGYPARLAPPERVARFEALWHRIAARHAGRKNPALAPGELAWAAVCAALVQHPEAELY